MRQRLGDIVLLEGNNELNVTMTPVVVPIAGSVSPGLIWYEGLAGWEILFSGREIPLNTEIHVAPDWVNESEVIIRGHIDLLLIYPNGTEQTLSVISGSRQDEEAAPGNGWIVQFEPFISSQEGTYTLVATLSSAGQVLDSVTFELVAVALAPPGGEILEIRWRETAAGSPWHPITETLPEHQHEYYLGFTVKNTGSTAPFWVGIWVYDAFAGWHWLKSRSFDIEAGSESLIEWPLWFGRSGDEDITFHLFSDDTEVDSMTVRITVL